jgi:hemerythrin superfamily protein
MEAIQLLLSDHRKVKNLFEQFRAQTDRSHQLRVFSQIFHELQMHAQIEERVFYPACSGFPDCKELVEDSYEDHQLMKDELQEISTLAQDSDDFVMMVEDLMDDVEDHVEEEETELFPLVREQMDLGLLQRLGEEMEAVKRGDLGSLEKRAA